MWILYACGSAVFAGITSILAKCGIKKADSNVATAIRTIIVLIFSWLMVWITGAQKSAADMTPRTFLFLVLSGLATGASWLCYFRALKLGDVSKVVPVDKSSIILTIILAFVILHETVSLFKVLGMTVIGAGTFLMIRKSEHDEKSGGGQAGARKSSGRWLIWALLSAVFASLTSILAKIGITGIDSNFGTAVRTCVVLVMAWIVVFVTKKQDTVKDIPKRELVMICLSGIATGASWLCYYRALQDGPASVVVPIDKLSILPAVAFSAVFLHERLSRRGLLGLLLVTVGTLLMLV